MISVIMPCFNGGLYLADALDSVLAQTFTDWEIIFINDGSTDNSLELAQEFALKDSRIKILDQTNSGVISARNNGVAASCGEYVFPLDCDDKIAPECLAELHKIMLTHRDIPFAIAAPRFSYFGYESYYAPLARPTKFNIYSRRYWNPVSSLFRRADFDAVGGFDSDFYLGTEDTDFFLKFIDRGGKIYESDDILFFYRNFNPANASNRNRDATGKYERQILEMLKERHPKMRCAMRFYKILKLFFETRVSRETVRVSRFLRIPLRTKFRGKI